MAEASIVLRLDSDLKREFEWVCDQVDQTASQVLRACMRKFINETIENKANKIILDRSIEAHNGLFIDFENHEEVLSLKKKKFLCDEFERLNPGVKLLDYSQRENLKEEAYAILNDKNKSVSERADAAVKIVKSHFMRSVQSFINTDRISTVWKHPGFDVYAKHYISKLGFSAFDTDVYEEMLRRFPLDGESQMGDSSYWRN